MADRLIPASRYNRVVLDAPTTVTALGTAIAVVGLVVTLGKGLIAVVRVGKALAAELGFFKKFQNLKKIISI